MCWLLLTSVHSDGANWPSCDARPPPCCALAAEDQSLACAYAALILHDGGKSIDAVSCSSLLAVRVVIVRCFCGVMWARPCTGSRGVAWFFSHAHLCRDKQPAVHVLFSFAHLHAVTSSGFLFSCESRQSCFAARSFCFHANRAKVVLQQDPQQGGCDLSAGGY